MTPASVVSAAKKWTSGAGAWATAIAVPTSPSIAARAAHHRGRTRITPASYPRSDDSDEAGADPVARAVAAVPELRGEPVLLGLGGEVGLRRRAAETLPGRDEELVVARRAGGVRWQVLPARLALHDRPRDRPWSAGPGGPQRAGALRQELGERVLGPPAARARDVQRGGARGAGLREGGAPRPQAA